MPARRAYEIGLINYVVPDGQALTKAKQIAQRIAVDFHLEPLSLDETRHYIRHRLQVAGGEPELFNDAACESVYRHSGGTPRLINLICDTTLVYGYAEQAPQIHASLVDEVAREKQAGGIFPRVQWPERGTGQPGPVDDVVGDGPRKKFA